MKRYLIALGVVAVCAVVVVIAHPGDSQATGVVPPLVDTLGRPLFDGDVVGAADYGDPDLFIIKIVPCTDGLGCPRLYKRLFLNPAIFNMYGHLGGFARVRRITPDVRDAFETSGLFRNCETDDQRVWAVEVTGEDVGILHHVQMSGAQATAEDEHFFRRIFCINTREDNFYARSIQPYTRLADVPRYERRACQPRPACLDSEPRCLMAEPAEGWCPQPTPACGREGSDIPATAGNTCCAGLTPVQRKDMNGNGYGSSSWKCARPGCYYQDVQCVRAPCDPVLVCPSPTPTPTSGPCYVGGCSSQLCTDRPDAASTCEYRAEYACYRYARCERQSSGSCGWSATDQFSQCWANAQSGY